MEELILLEECPVCRGAGMIMHEGGWCVQVECADCSAQTIFVEYNSEEEKKESSSSKKSSSSNKTQSVSSEKEDEKDEGEKEINE